MSIKDQLLYGDIVTAQNGWTGIYILSAEDNAFLNTNEGRYIPISDYDDDLRQVQREKQDFDIIKIRRPAKKNLSPEQLDVTKFSLVWTRETILSGFKSGDLVCMRNGFRFIYMRNWGDDYPSAFLGVEGSWMYPEDYDPYTLKHPFDPAWDVIKVYRPNDYTAPWACEETSPDLNLVWEEPSKRLFNNLPEAQGKEGGVNASCVTVF